MRQTVDALWICIFFACAALSAQVAYGIFCVRLCTFARSTIPGIPEPQIVGRATAKALTLSFN